MKSAVLKTANAQAVPAAGHVLAVLKLARFRRSAEKK
jgi:hypothetical protein